MGFDRHFWSWHPLHSISLDNQVQTKLNILPANCNLKFSNFNFNLCGRSWDGQKAGTSWNCRKKNIKNRIYCQSRNLYGLFDDNFLVFIKLESLFKIQIESMPRHLSFSIDYANRIDTSRKLKMRCKIFLSAKWKLKRCE